MNLGKIVKVCLHWRSSLTKTSNSSGSCLGLDYQRDSTTKEPIQHGVILITDSSATAQVVKTASDIDSSCTFLDTLDCGAINVSIPLGVMLAKDSR
jgi:hypothetical protein